MQETKKIKKIVLIAVAVFLCVGIGIFCIIFGNIHHRKSTEPKKSVASVTLSVDTRTIELGVNQTQKIKVSANGKTTFSSSDEKIATVDKNGNVKGVSRGNTLITVSVGHEKQSCGVMVEPKKTIMDIRKVNPTMLFSDVQLFHASEIVGFGYSKTSHSFYFSQEYANGSYGTIASDSMLTKVSFVKNQWQRTEKMHLYEHGYGYLCVDDRDDGDYLLSESNGAYFDEGTTISKFQWENNRLLDQEFGQTFHFKDTKGALSIELDQQNDLAALRVVDGRDVFYQLYNYTEMCKTDEPIYVKKIQCKSDQTPEMGEDESKGRYNATVRGFMIHNGYIYQLSGSSSIYISVFDLDGKLQYCHRVKEFPDISYRHPVSLCFAEGKIYLAITSGNSELYKANVMVFDGGFAE